MKKILIALAVLCGLLVIAFNFYKYSKLPTREGQLELTGLQQSVTVVYDQWAIPHIQAKNEADLFRALGFVHAQDRLFQMDLLRRLGKGELAALLGEPGIGVDKLFRTIGTRKFSFDQTAYIEKNHPEIATLLTAYYDGINQAIEKLPKPVEYDILQTNPEPFSIVDGMGIFAYIAHSFTSGLTQDPIITALHKRLSPEHFAALILRWPLDAKFNVQQSSIDQADLLNFADNAEQLIEQLPFGIVHGSNAWAISANRSKSGKTLIANDPHIAFSSPSVWYETQTTAPNINIYGHYLAGIPFPLLIRKEHLAQGLTMLTSDDADLIALQYNDDNSQVLIEGSWQDVVQTTETIKVKGSEDISFNVTSTTVGPIVNEALKLENANPIAFYWLYTRAENKPLKSIYDMYRADNLQSFENALAQHWAPGLNVVYADKNDNIAQWAFGRYLKRPDGNNGLVMVDGTQPNTIPTDIYPFSHNPRIINPQSGYVFSTNHAFPNSEPESGHLGYYSPIYRAIWANEKLSQGSDWNLEKMKQLIIESENKRSALSLAKLKAVIDTTKLSKIEAQSFELLMSWNGKYSAKMPEPAIFERFYYHLLHSIFADEMGDEIFKRLVSRSVVGNSLYRFLQRPNALWWDNQNTDTAESMADIFQSAFAKAIASLSNEFGSDATRWQWQKIASVTHGHPLGKVKPLNKLFNVGPFVVEGSRRSLNNMQYKYTDAELITTNGPSTRRVIDFADPKNAFTVLPTGQSGNVFDQYYDDQAELYHSNEFRKATMLEVDDRPEKSSVLQLVPSD